MKKLDAKKGILLDIGCRGNNKQEHFVGMSKIKEDGIDVVHDPEKFPYPFKDDSCLTIVGHYMVNKIKPWLMIEFMDELWRILKPHGTLAFSCAYGTSDVFMQEPFNCNIINFATFQHFDPKYQLWQVYKPKPWKIREGFPVYQTTGTLEIILEKRPVNEKVI